VFGFLYLITLLLPSLTQGVQKKHKEEKSEKFPITSTGSKLFYTADFDEDISKDQDYLGKNREIRYTNQNVSTYITEQNIGDLGDTAKFFKDYMNTVITGDYQKYPEYFTEKYKNKKNAFDKRAQDLQPFTKQKLYDIEVRFLDAKQVDGENGKVTYSFYHVEYKILKNNGTFRNDLDDEGIIPLVFSLVTENNKTLISDISTYNHLTKNAKK